MKVSWFAGRLRETTVGLDHRAHSAVMILPEGRSFPLGNRSFRTFSSIAVLGLISDFRMVFICRREYCVSFSELDATQSEGTSSGNPAYRRRSQLIARRYLRRFP